MQKQPIRKAISLLIIVSLMLSILPGSWSVNAVGEETTQVSKTNLDFAEPIQENTEITETISPLNADAVPEIIGYEEALNKNHVQRLYSDEEEDLNKVVFLNADGTKTMYLYDFPVKYVDTNGIIRDVSLDIADTAAGFETASGSTVTTFATDMSDGISLRGNDVEISLVPLLPVTIGTGSISSSASSAAGNTASRTATRIDSKTIAYPYDAKTTIEYSLTYTGFKEDIVVSEYTGQTEYAFRLYTNGYALTEIDGSFYLVDEVGNIKATIGDIIIFTADERNNTIGQLVPTTIVENEQYLLTIVVDAEFLADEKTVYPIRIDPTIEIFYAEDNVGDIEDITVCNGTTYSGTSGSLYVGLKSGAGICRALMKFPIVEDLPDNITIQSAYIKVRDLMCESTAMNIECYVFAGNTWAESTANWTNTNAGSSSSIGTHLCTVTMDYDIGRTFTNKHWYSFDITEAVQGWIDGTDSLDAGIVFKMPTSHENGSTYTYRTIGSFNRSSNQPMGEITYSVIGGVIEVRKDSSVTLSTSGIDGVVTSWTSSNPDVASVNASGIVSGLQVGTTTISAYSGSDLQKTFTVQVLLANGVYWIGSAIEGLYMSANGGSISNGAPVELHSLYSGLPNNLLQLWKICYLGNSQYSIRPMHRLSMGLDITGEDVDIWTAGTADTLTDVPGYCRWYILYESDGYVFVNYSEGFVLSYAANAGEGTVLCGDIYSEADGSFYWTVTEMSIPPSGIVFFNTNKNELCTTATIYAEVSQTKTLAEMGLVLSVYSGHTNSQAVVWQSGDNNTATVQSVSGSATGRQRGETNVTVTTIIDSVMYSVGCTLIVCKTIYVINRYDSTIGSDTALVESIDDAVDFLNVIYRDEFYLNFEMDGTPQLYADAFIAECELGVTAHCTKDVCGGVCTEHHKNLFRIAYDLYDQFWQANHIVVKWSDCPPSTYCQGDHVLSNAYAVTAIVNSEPLPIVQVLCIKEGSGCTAEGFMAINLAHEVAHTLGVKEVYRGDYSPNDIATHLEYYLDPEKTMPCVMAAALESHIDALYQKEEAALCDNCRGYLESEIPDDPYAE